MEKYGRGENRTLYIRTSKELRKWLENEALCQGVPMASVIRRVLRAAMEGKNGERTCG